MEIELWKQQIQTAPKSLIFLWSQALIGGLYVLSTMFIVIVRTKKFTMEKELLSLIIKLSWKVLLEVVCTIEKERQRHASWWAPKCLTIQVHSPTISEYEAIELEANNVWFSFEIDFDP